MEKKANTLEVRKGVGRLSPYRNVRNDHGASFVELIIVMVIIVVLAAIATPIYLNFKKKGTVSVAQSDGKAIAGEISALTADIPNYGAELGSISVSGNTLTVSYGNPASPTVLTTPIKMSADSVVYSTAVRNGSWCFVVQNKTTGYAKYTNDGMVASQVNTPLTCNMFSADEASFESGTVAGWTAGGNTTIAVDDTVAADGGESLMLTQTAGTYASVVSANYASYLVSGNKYTFSFYVYNSGATARTVTFQLATNAGNVNWANLGSAAPGVWTRFTTTFTVGATYTSAKFQPVISAAIGDVSYIDKTSLTSGVDTTWTNGF